MRTLVLALLLAGGSGSSVSPGVAKRKPVYMTADFTSGTATDRAKASTVPSAGGTFVSLTWTQQSAALGAGAAMLSVTLSGETICSMRVPCGAADGSYRCPALGSATCPASSTCAEADFAPGDVLDVKFTSTTCTLGAFPVGIATVELIQ